MEHYTPRGYIYQYQPGIGYCAEQTNGPNAFPCPNNGFEYQETSHLQQLHNMSPNMAPALELHAPRPTTMVFPPMPIVEYSPLAEVPFASYGPGSNEFSTALANMHLTDTDVPALQLYQAPDSPGSSSGYSGFMEPMQATFPTPSELLAELAEKGMSVASDEAGSDTRSESASKARRRAMAKRVGFTPTDPDTISSHEKKRHYLECLEQYITYLHEQFALLRREHAPLERVASYKGFTSRSIRTMLVHMENTTRDLNIRTLAEEGRFIGLRDEVLQQELDNAANV